ncbi:MAG: hypothetical protein R3F59_09885 [Myxococcota bacterium]
MRDQPSTPAPEGVEERIRRDLEALAAVPHRYAGTEGEREMLHQVRNRLPSTAPAPEPTPASAPGSGPLASAATPAGVERPPVAADGVRVGSRIEGFVAYTSPGLILGGHALALLVIGVLGLWWPLPAAFACAAVTLSLVAEGSGWYSALRRVLPKSASYNLVWRSVVDEPLGSLVIAAPLDTPRWRPNRPKWLRRPMQLLVAAAVVLTVVVALRALAEPWGRPTQGMYAVSLGVLGAAAGIGAMAHRRAGGTDHDASGPAALLELVRRFEDDPLPGVDLWAVFTGCGHAYQNGMHAFLAMRGKRLREPVLVLALAEPGRSDLRPSWPRGHCGRSSTARPAPWSSACAGPGSTCPRATAPRDRRRAAMLWGYRALALGGGGGGPSTVAGTVRAVEVAEAVARLRRGPAPRARPAPRPAAPASAPRGRPSRARARAAERAVIVGSRPMRSRAPSPAGSPPTAPCPPPPSPHGVRRRASTVADADGRFRLELPPWRYRVRAEAAPNAPWMVGWSPAATDVCGGAVGRGGRRRGHGRRGAPARRHRRRPGHRPRRAASARGRSPP